MPIYEYECNKCSEKFEKLVYGDTKVKCPRCETEDIKKRFSLFGMSGVEKQTSSGCSSCTASTCSTCK
jgi:putative FmdB family regulatory protein